MEYINLPFHFIYYKTKKNSFHLTTIHMSVLKSLWNCTPKTNSNFNDQIFSNQYFQNNNLSANDLIDHQMFCQFTNTYVFQPFQYPQILQQKLSPPYKQKQISNQQVVSGIRTTSQTCKSLQSSKQFSHLNESLTQSKHKQTPIASRMFNVSNIPTNSMALSNLLGRTFLQLTHNQNQNNFYSFCMLLFPQHSKCLPIDIEILDTIFFQTDKDLIYVYKDSKKGLVKIKNKNKQIYQLFTKRKNTYETIQHKQSKRKISKQNHYFKQLNAKSKEISNFALKTTKSLFLTETFNSGELPEIIKSLPKLQFDDTKWSQLVTPDNTRRKNHQNQQLNYMALLRYKDNSFLRLKQNQFKAIFLNPLYANQRFKNHNNTQYIQWLPQQNPNEDIRTFSMFFSYQTFHKEQLFKFVINSCSKQNEFLRNQDKQFINIEKRKSILIKDYLKGQNQQVYLYYLIFQIYAYISMHYNKKLQSANFKFVKYDQIFALSSVENFIINPFDKEGEFLRVDLFQKNKIQELLQEQRTEKQLMSALSTPFMREQFNKKLLQSLQEKQTSQNQLQKHISQVLEKQNRKIKQGFVENINLKLDNIKNVKDIQLSKSVFKLLNPNVQHDFHQILNDQKKLKKLIISNDQNVYARKNISNFSMVRSIKRNRPLHSFQKTQNIFQSRVQTLKSFLASTAAQTNQMNCKFKKIQTRRKIQKRKELNQTYIDFNKTNFKFKGLKNNF